MADGRDDPAFTAGGTLLHSLFDGMFEGVQIVDFTWRYVYLNATAASHGRSSREALLGRTMMEAYPGIETTEMFGLLRRCMEAREPQSMVNAFAYPDGGRAWFELRINPVPMGVLVLSVDITERMEREERDLQSRKMDAVGRLAAGVAHDFNNLIGVIGGYAEMALGGLAPGDPNRELVEPIVAAARRAKELTGKLLAFSRKQVLKPQAVDLNAALAGVTGMLKRVLGEDIDFAFSPAPDTAPVSIDPGQLDQIIVNLVLNARDAMPSGGKLTVETANVHLDADYIRRHGDGRPGPHAMIAVTDTGIGMDAATQAQVFDPFFTTKVPGKGTGLGLSTVYGIVKQSGGNIWVYSEPGVGTTFKVYLPRHEGVVEPRAEASAAPAAPPPGHETLLLVEDEPELREWFRKVLAGQGYRVFDTGDARAALEICRRELGEIHLLLTDMVMPGMNGRALAEEVLALRPAIKVAYMSGYTDDVVVRHGILGPGSAFIEKPVSSAELLKRIRDLLR